MQEKENDTYINKINEPNKISKSKELLICALLLFVGMVWGCGFVAQKTALNFGFTAVSINLFRFATASLLMVIAMPKTVFSITGKELKAGLLPSLCMASGFFFQNLGMETATPAYTALITGLYVILTPFLSYIFLKTKIKAVSYIAAALSFIGVGILSAPSLSIGSFKWGDAILLLSAFSFAFHFITVNPAAKIVEAKKLTFIQMACSTLMFLIVFLLFDLDNFANINPLGFVPIALLGIFCSFLAYFIQTKAQSVMSPTKVAIFLSTESLFGTVFSTIFGFENITIYLILGAAVIISGLVLAQINQD